MFVDSHCHLNFPDFSEDREAVIKRAWDAGVKTLLTISTKSSEIKEIQDIADRHPHVFCTVGIHPHEALKDRLSEEQLIAFADHEKTVGIGETGLDYYYENSPKEDQQESFRRHIRVCLELDLPLIVHTREAEEDTMRILREEANGAPLKGLLHCFSSGRKLAEDALAFGFYISFSGILTFKKATELRDIAKDIPLNRLLIETDAPFLAPVPKRSQRNEPAFVIHTAQQLADLKDVSLKTIQETTTENFFTVFKECGNKPS